VEHHDDGVDAADHIGDLFERHDGSPLQHRHFGEATSATV